MDLTVALFTAKATGTVTYRPEIGSVPLSLLTAAYLLFFTNRTFWSKVHTYLSAYPVAIVALYGAMAALFGALIIIFSAKYLIKPFLIFLIFAAAAASWFMDRYGIVIDSDMIRNAMETTQAEAGNLITPGFLWHMAIYGLVPSLLIVAVRVRHRTILDKLLWNTISILICLTIAGIISFANSKTFTTAVRQHKDIVKSVNPLSPIMSAIHYFTLAGKEVDIQVSPVGRDAKILPSLGGVRKPRITVIVAGETARAANFSLNGYGRETNPELAKRGVIYFPNTTSCGTATAISIPCMFSKFPRSQYSHNKALANENVMDVLVHAGVSATWLDNNTGSKNVADRIPYFDLPSTNDSRFCTGGECRDDIFFDKLDSWLNNVTRDSVIVLHQMGSHGPTYYLRYTDEFRKFTPDCRTAELGNCSDAEIVNSYDNTLLYTDHFLSTVIDKLKARSDRLATSMIYASDHGESLGESGVYLHGAPYLLAPDQQTHVPFLVWFDDDFAKSMGLNKACLAKTAAEGGRSHDNYFHSILGMMNVSTSVYDPSLDVFGGCTQRQNS
ncbi:MULTISPECIES: phosphoethanolamine transferase [Agrobacterium]|uniref:Phosphoethanolamine transferase n=1 Tax=Agrobacterium salinitolerans TaxID=1183413 RepID=A0A9X3QZI3_9HYPH|nr:MULTISPECIES: phosphoethanolamine--lipid A transferase [Agrobacterium]PNQ21339.1 phosphoethanolamine transferase [Rhizobium sp. YIC5082]MCZ7893094.1 phosphoethanolamine--lipid A transferase [Agrobacterium salinitolerans]MCZ7938048.1 phosphoethanolamine--lipid A transferase [Agrobacterium salinitolerans]MDA5638730.1 phosphoethanolamine--lipid A transferase [Agrobacterium sp. ST15.13.013]MDA6998366.1 phosphoethanolamine--lipid A transferase [Agrobacterium salinitolerans]